jgi:hypothetical protein
LGSSPGKKIEKEGIMEKKKMEESGVNRKKSSNAPPPGPSSAGKAVSLSDR